MIFFKSGVCCENSRHKEAYYTSPNLNTDNQNQFWSVLLRFPKQVLSAKLVLIMKLTFFLTALMVMNVSASSYSQTVTFTGKNVPLEKVFTAIKKQTGYVFFYNFKLLDQAKPVTLDVSAVQLSEVLKTCFKNQSLDYSIEDKTIVITQRISSAGAGLNTQIKVAPPKTIKGRVVDTKGKPLPGATVKIKNANKVVQTNAQGEFELKDTEDKVLLYVSFIGYKPQEVIGRSSDAVTIILEDVEGSLNQVVVVAYGTSKVKDVTGSVSHLGTAEIANAPMGASVQSLLQGKAAGVNVMIQSASPSSPVSVIIRGASSLSGNNQPLWVIDGVPDYSNTSFEKDGRINSSISGNIANKLYNLNLNDVESIDILKDASATAIYGSRGAAGVVLVTTKHGREGMKPTIEFSTRYGKQFIDKSKIGVLVADEYINLSKASVREAVMTVGGLDYFTRQFIDEAKFNNKFKNTSHLTKGWITDDLFRSDAYLSGNTDWWDLMTRNEATQDYSLSLRGGTKQSSYYTSVFMKDQDGVVIGGNSKTYGMRFNFESSVRDILKLGININANARSINNKDAMLGVILKMRPDFPAYNPDGSINKISTYTKNPLLELQDRNEGKGKSGAVSMFLEYDIRKGLKLRTTGTADYSTNKTDVFRKTAYDGNLNSRTIDQSENTVLVWENTLNYFKTFGKHDINALAGFSMEQNDSEGFSAIGTNFPDEEVLIDLGSAAIKSSIRSSLYSNSLVSGFARLNYKFNNRYLITGTVRKDGSSRFGLDRRWGFFPSAALGWIITEEAFAKPYSHIFSYLKLRGSIGKTGSQNLGNYAWQTLMGARIYNGLPGIVPSTLGNDILQWESQNQIDLGLDYGLLNDRIRGSFGWYQKKVSNLLYSDPVPTSSAFSTVTQNIGSLKNQGLEFDVKGDVLSSANLTWTLDLNVGHNVGRLEKLNSSAKFYGGTANEYFRVDVGGKLGDFYGYKYAGKLFRTQEEIIALKPLLPTGYQDVYRDAYENPGDLYLMDLNKDGKVTVDDRTNLGNANPDIYGGFGSTVIWKDFYFNATFSYALGGKRIFDLEKSTSGDMNVYNVPSMALDSWTMKGEDGTLPRLTYYGRGANNIMSDRYLHDASYLRLSALNVSYRLPKKLMNDRMFKTVEFSFQAANLFTITKYPGFDPQGNFSASSTAFMSMGVDYSTYPQARTFTFGLKFILN
ncbi:SusC/RagA family TonB-linked outer membrane protein [Pedobacter hiemivivus]|uniref:SusC/RagA family TonB-linked outer membrane protein n=2 Tax=Pedobacter hiemivivus TaxID=2530454 RepID=A0A4R0MQ32_9SPHI|nr:SusC/RagA family TonB-linked outer membrane protein [Pedobacter hiemivivus]